MASNLPNANLDRQEIAALLRWHIEAGCDEAIAETPIDRFAAAPPPPPETRGAPAPSATAQQTASAQQAADAADTLDALYEALCAFDGCPLKQTAKNTVFSDGVEGSRQRRRVPRKGR